MDWTEQQEFQNALFCFVLDHSATHQLIYKLSSFFKKYVNDIFCCWFKIYQRSASSVDPPDFLAVSIAPALNHCDYGTTEALKCCFSKLPWRAITHSLRPPSHSTPAEAPLGTLATSFRLTSIFKRKLCQSWFLFVFFFPLFNLTPILEVRRHREPLVALRPH